jgi:radical SAM superfamily enzyme YgiQ (UPF0313 family)
MPTTMPAIVLLTFNARYHHASFGLRYLKANLGELEPQSQILEFDLDKRPAEALESILRLNPQIIGLAVYIWNTRQSLEFAQLLKAIRPDIHLILGGPEISHEFEHQPLADAADHILCGEADLAFRDLCQQLLAGQTPPRIIEPPLPNLTDLALPYRLYTDDDIRHRTLYVESSRGCPFSCEFCLSSLDIPVRRFPLQPFLAEMQTLLDRGCRQFKFVDRTFNVAIDHACTILQFFLDRMQAGLFLHFEMIPDRLPESVKDLLAQFPAGSLQLEIGIQTFDEPSAERISRKQNNMQVEANFHFLREHTQAHLHADLIAGLPGETLESFAAGFDRLLALQPHEIQLGILKRLRGAPIARHTDEFGIIYSPEAPYEILQSHQIDFATMQRIKRMARYWDLYANSGQFKQSLPLLWLGQGPEGSPFWRFLQFSDFIYAKTGKTHQISLPRQFEFLYEHLGKSPEAGQSLAADYLHPGRRDLPAFLEPHAPTPTRQTKTPKVASPPRQARHL